MIFFSLTKIYIVVPLILSVIGVLLILEVSAGNSMSVWELWVISVVPEGTISDFHL